MKTVARVALPSLLMLAALPALAQLQVSGTITSSQRWQVTDSPVRVTDDLIIENGAVLTIDPGVRVEVAADASVTVRNGALYAVGTPSARIVLTSAKVPAQAQPGDWGALRFEDGTLDAQSALDHATVEYGNGLTIAAASPTLRNLTIRHHAAPAILLDTRSSPMGEGLVATGNTLDGILVAAGVVSGDVVWGLRGIPYVVRSGTVEVGSLGFGLVPERLRLVEGVQGRLEVNLPEAAPAGGTSVTVASSVPSVVTTPENVAVAAGATRADIQITAVSAGNAVVTASGAGFEPARADIEVLPRPQLQSPATLTLNPTETQRITVNLSARAPDAGLQLVVSNSAASTVEAPAVLQVPPRARSVQFDVRGVLAGASTLTLSAPGWQSAVTDVVVRGRELILPAEIFVRPGRSTSATVSVAQPVEGSALAVTVAASQAGIVGLPSSIAIPVGATSATFTVDGLAVGTVGVTATGPGYGAGSTTARVERLELAWEIPTTYDAAAGAQLAYVPRNFQSAARLRLNRAAPAGGVRVRLRVADTGSVSFPITEVTIPEGQTQPASLVRFRGEALALTELVAESDEADEARQTLRVGPPATLRFNNGGPTFTLGRSMAARPALILESDGRYVPLLEPVAVAFTSSDPTRVETANEVTIGIIGQSVPGPLVVGRATTSTSVGLEGQVTGAGLSARLDISVVTPQVSLDGLEGQRALGATRDQFLVALRVNAPDAGTQWVNESVDAQISIVDANPEGVIPGLYLSNTGGNPVAQVGIDAGTQMSRSAYVGTPSATGSYRVRAVVPGVGSLDSDLQRVVIPRLSITRTSGAVAVGMRTRPGYLTVTRQIGGSAAFVSSALTVQLEISDGTKASIPTSVTIPAGNWAVDFQVQGLAASADSVTIRASAPDHEVGDALQLRVLQPTLSLSGLDDRRSLGGVRDWFLVTALADDPSAIPSVLVSPRTIALSLASPNPVDVVAGFFDRFSSIGGAPITEVTIPAGESAVSVHVGEGQKVGTYRVRAESVGAITAESPEQRISSPEIRFNVGEVVVGSGFDSRYYLYVERRQDGQLIAASTPTVVALTNPRPDAISVPDNVTIPANATRVEIPVRGLSVSSGIVLAASASTLGSTTTLVSVATPIIEMRSLDGSRALASRPDYFSLALTVAGGVWQGLGTPVSDIVVNLEVTERSPVNVVPGLFSDEDQNSPVSQVIIAAGSLNSSAVFVGTPGAVGSYRIRASASGLEPATSELQTVSLARIELGSSGFNGYQPIGVGMEKPIYVQFVVGYDDGEGGGGYGTYYNEEDVTLALECVDPTICGVLDSVVVPSTCSECSIGATFAVRGLRPGFTTLRVTAPGFEPAELAISVRRLVPVLDGLPTSIAAGDEPPSFRILEWGLEEDRAFGEDGTQWDYDQSLFADILVDVVSDVPDYVGISTPAIPGRISVGSGGSESATIVLPSPRVPIRAAITVSGPGLVSQSQDVLVE